MKNNKGFTLIELVVVIVILGILSAVAAPKFMDLQKDARISAIQGLNGAIKSAVNMTFAKSIVQGTDRTELYAGSGVEACPDDDSSTVICTVFGNPSAQKNGIINALQNKDSFQILTSAGSCDNSKEWCYYQAAATSTGTGTIYFAPSSTVGYTGDEATSCALKYSLEKKTDDKTSTVTTTALTTGC